MATTREITLQNLRDAHDHLDDVIKYAKDAQWMLTTALAGRMAAQPANTPLNEQDKIKINVDALHNTFGDIAGTGTLAMEDLGIDI